MLFEGIEEKKKYYPLLGFPITINNTSDINNLRNYLSKNKILVNIFVIGCGGTGGYLVPNLSRLIAVKTSDYIQSNLVLIDGDEVEYKNLSRQNFIERDLGKNKAEVLANRYSKAFNINIFSQNEYLSKICSEITEISSSFAEEHKQETQSKKYIKKLNVIISCVDNVGTRCDIIKYIGKQIANNLNTSTVVIDAGNTEFAGQVLYTGKNMPTFIDIFPDTEDVKDRPNELSCADHALSAPQNIAANMTAAQLIFNYFNIAFNNLMILIKGIAERELKENIVRTMTPITHNITYFNIKDNTFSNCMEGNVDDICNEYKILKDNIEKNSWFSSCSETVSTTEGTMTVEEVNNREEASENEDEVENATPEITVNIFAETI